MPDDQRAIQLQQLANIIIEAYLNRDQQFTPDFEAGTQAMIYLTRPESGQDHPELRTNVWYEKSDYEPTVAPREKKQIEVPRNNAVIYIPVSTQEQVENLSLDTQEGRCKDLCQKSGWNMLRVFREEGKSAKTTGRDKFQQMLLYCKDDKNAVGYIVVYDLSRFARNMFDQLATERDLREAGIRLESVLERTDDSAVGRWQRNMLAANHQLDNDRRSERTVAGMTQAALVGRFPFKAPIGYINVSQHRGQNLIPDPKTAPLIRKGLNCLRQD